MRLFLGVDIKDDTKKNIRSSILELKNDYPEFYWIPEINYHITVFFFGERSEDKTQDIIEGIEQILFDVNQSYISIFRLGMFVQKEINIHITFNRNRVLELIHNRIISVIGSQIPQKHNIYIPHITLAKYKLPSKQQYLHLKKKVDLIDINIEFCLDSVHLYQSIIKKPFPEYRIIHTFHLMTP